nr:hypothetical protein CFP56_31988 [Quercus suber]
MNESINIMNKTLVHMEELMKDVSTQLQRLEEIHGPQAEDVFSKPKERKKVISNDTHKKRREFDDIHISLSDAFEILSKKDYLKPLEPTLFPIPIPSISNMNEYCAFHQKLGLKKNNYFRLKHEIQDLIDGGVIIKPRF